MNINQKLTIEVRGDYGMFCEPQTERSYPVPTPSALIGLIASVYGKPQFDIVIDEIIPINKPKYVRFTTNAVKTKLSKTGIRTLQKGGTVTRLKIPKTAYVLADVKFAVRFHLKINRKNAERDIGNMGVGGAVAKYYDIMKRRLINGTHFGDVCLGRREFLADIKFIEDGKSFTTPDAHFSSDYDYGFMTYKTHKGTTSYHAELKNGAINVK